MLSRKNAVVWSMGLKWLRFYFFFSSRRRHTRLQGDWSSDVCSSDLQGTTLDGITDKTLGIIIRSNSDTLNTISACTFLDQRDLFIDCIPNLPRKYVDRKSVV